MTRRKFLTKTNRIKLYRFLENYLAEVLQEEEYINSFEKAYQDAKRVELYGARKTMLPSYISDWLRGLPLSTEFITYKINVMLITAIKGTFSDSDLSFYYDVDELDNFYWETLGQIIFNKHFYSR